MRSIFDTTTAGMPANLFRILARRWHAHTGHLVDPYRPERHYMRGPGPKWREKHGTPADIFQ